jgi:Ser/Thr protein kinase RdoA (MazF antagonist)
MAEIQLRLSSGVPQILAAAMPHLVPGWESPTALHRTYLEVLPDLEATRHQALAISVLAHDALEAYRAVLERDDSAGYPDPRRLSERLQVLQPGPLTEPMRAGNGIEWTGAQGFCSER